MALNSSEGLIFILTGGKTPEDAIAGVENVTERITDLGLSG